MENETQHEIVWMVSFEVDDDGKLSDYIVDAIDLKDYRADVADNLRSKLGKGIFNSADLAEEWAKSQSNVKSCGCRCNK